MRMHYLPQFLLKQFVDGDTGLWQLDVTTGQARRTAIDKTAMERHLYTVKLETGYLQSLDGAASDLMDHAIIGRHRIELSVADREVFAEWIALLILRNIKKSQSAHGFVNEALAKPDALLLFIRKQVDDYASKFQTAKPVVWAEAVTEFGSEEGARDALAQYIEQMIRDGTVSTTQGPVDLALLPRNVFSKSITQERAKMWASWMLPLHWQWVRTANEFLVGDDPVSRWSPKLKRIEYGFGNDDCEVTVPLSRHLTLCMQRDPYKSGAMGSCDYRTTCSWNNRQMLAATRRIYGSHNQMTREKYRLQDIAAGRCRLPRGG